MTCTVNHLHSDYMPVDTVTVVVGGDGVVGAVVGSVGCSVVGSPVRSIVCKIP